MTSANLIKKSVMGGVMLMGLSLLSQPAQAIAITYSFGSGDNGLSTITKTDSGSGVTLTLSNPNANGGKFGADNDGLALGSIGSLANGTSQFSLSFSQAVTLNSYVIGYVGTSAGTMNPFSISTSTDNPLDPTGNYNFNNPFTLTANQNYTLSTTLPISGFSLSQIKSITVDSTPVPWETDTLSLIGSTVLFASGLWAKSKFAKPLQK